MAPTKPAAPTGGPGGGRQPGAVAPANARPGQGQARPPAARAASASNIRVRATKVGYYDDKRRRIGDVFTISGATFTEGPRAGQVKEFSSNWMERVDPRTNERITTGQQSINKQHDEILAGKAIENNPELGGRPTGEQPAIEDEEGDLDE